MPGRTHRAAAGGSFAAVLLALLFASPVAAAGPGEFDRSFSGDGYRLIDLGGVAEPWKILPEPNGGFTVAGERRRTYYTNNERPRSLFVRFLSDGKLDVDFGNGGTLLVDAFPGLAVDTPTGWDRTADGRYVIVGHLPERGGYYLIRLKHDGRRDGSFAPGGMRTWPLTRDWHPIDALALPDGRIVLLGGSDGDMVLRAHLEDGSLDRSFGDSGETIVRGDTGIELILDSDRLIVAGQSRDRFVLRALGLDGRPDLSFGQRGRAASPDLRDGGFLDYGGTVALAGGGFAITGRPVFAGDEPVFLVRFKENGTLDQSFGGGDGWRTLNVPTFRSQNIAEFFPYDLVELPGSRLAIAGYWSDPPYDDDGRWPTKIFVAAFNEDGSRWRAFGDDGVFASNFGLRRENWYLGTMAVVGDKLLVSASVERYFSEKTQMVVARLTLD